MSQADDGRAEIIANHMDVGWSIKLETENGKHMEIICTINEQVMSLNETELRIIWSRAELINLQHGSSKSSTERIRKLRSFPTRNVNSERFSRRYSNGSISGNR